MMHTEQELNKNIQRIKEKSKKLRADGIQLRCSIDNKTNSIVLNSIEILNTVNGMVEIEIPSEIDILYNNRGMKPFILNMQNKPVNYIRLINSNTKIDGYIGPLYRQDDLNTVDFQQFTFGKIASTQFLLSNLSNLKKVCFRQRSMYSIKNTNNMFYKCENLEEVSFKGAGLMNIETAAGMFSSCPNLREIHFQINAMKKCRNWQGTFRGCYNLDGGCIIDILFDQAENLEETFRSCHRLGCLFMSCQHENQPAIVRNVSGMVSNCGHIAILDMRDLNTDMVLNCEDFAIGTDIDEFITRKNQFKHYNALMRQYGARAYENGLNIGHAEWIRK